ncbi:MAG: aldo/keto reductase [Alphaproteobacteria bacterium]|nr:aldo/keto reductase [Alphaproteobacteria bacterium]
MSKLAEFSDGQKIPQLGFGVAGILPEDTQAMVEGALGAGYLMIDNASIYKNEVEVGRALERSDVAAGDVFVTSKVWPLDYGFDNVIKACHKSLGDLRREAFDLYLLHWPVPSLGLYVESWKALIELQKQGLVKSIGVSNFYPEQLQKLIDETGVVPVINQIELHPYYQRRAEKKFHDEHNIVTQCWSPLGRATCLLDDALVGIAAKHDKTPAQIVLNWQIEQGNVVIPRSRNMGRMQQNFDVYGFELDDEDRRQIAALDKGLDGRLGEDFDLKELPND